MSIDRLFSHEMATMQLESGEREKREKKIMREKEYGYKKET